MRARLLVRTLTVFLLAAVVAGCGDDDGPTVAPDEVVERTSTSAEGNEAGEPNTATDDPVDTAAGRSACQDIPADAAGADAEELRSIADGAPAALTTAIEGVIDAAEGGDPAEVDDATEELVKVCQAYGIELEQTSGG